MCTTISRSAIDEATAAGDVGDAMTLKVRRRAPKEFVTFPYDQAVQRILNGLDE